MNIAPYRKLVAAAAGIVVLAVSRHTDVDLMPYSDLIVEIAVSAATLVAVYQFRNDPLL